jgi:hypothetical protein
MGADLTVRGSPGRILIDRRCGGRVGRGNAWGGSGVMALAPTGADVGIDNAPAARVRSEVALRGVGSLKTR